MKASAKHFFEDGIINACIETHKKEGRQEWKYKPLSEKQLKILINYFTESELEQIDRGCGKEILSIIFNESRIASFLGSFPYLGSDIEIGESTDCY